MTGALIGVLAALLLVSGPGLAWAQRFDEAAALADARARWARAGIVRYRLSIVPDRSQCRVTYEIERERVLTSGYAGESCPSGERLASKGRTVPELFARIGGLIRDPPCGPNGCRCDGYLTPIVEYDASRGYPRSLDVGIGGRREGPPRGECTVMGYSDFVEVRVESLP